MSGARPWVIIGNPENRRVLFFQQALASRGIPPALELSYADLLTGRCSVDQVPRGAIVRIDSPGENFAVERLLLAAGAPAAEEEGSPVIRPRRLERLPDDPGRILNPRQWYLGFQHTLRDLETGLAARPDVTLTSAPSDILLMFDKPRCHQACRVHEVAVPQALPMVASFEELAAAMRERQCPRVMVKLAHGSSASGVVAIHRRGERWEAITSAEMVTHGNQTRLYNSLRIRRYTSREHVERLVNSLLPHRVQLEEWLPKASLAGRPFDLRVVVIRGEPQHAVVRTSRSPLTNLHLGNRRGDLEAFRARLGEAAQLALDETCRRTAALCPDSLHVGLDLLITPGFKRHFVLEMNAFGDLLPNVLCRGKSTYEAEIEAVHRQLSFGHALQ